MAIFLTVNPAVECRTKHIDIGHHYIQEQYENKVIEPFHIAGVNNPADLFTKSFAHHQSGTILIQNRTILEWFGLVGVLKQNNVRCILA